MKLILLVSLSSVTLTTSTSTDVSTDVSVAQEEMTANAGQTSAMVVNFEQNPPMTDRKIWPACDGR